MRVIGKTGSKAPVPRLKRRYLDQRLVAQSRRHRDADGDLIARDGSTPEVCSMEIATMVRDAPAAPRDRHDAL